MRMNECSRGDFFTVDSNSTTTRAISCSTESFWIFIIRIQLLWSQFPLKSEPPITVLKEMFTINNLQLLDDYFSKFLHGIQICQGNYLSHSDVHDWIVMRKKIVKENTNLSKNECFFSHNWSHHLHHHHHHQPPPQKNHYCSWRIERLKLQLLVLLESILPFFWKFSPLLSFPSWVAS